MSQEKTNMYQPPIKMIELVDMNELVLQGPDRSECQNHINFFFPSTTGSVGAHGRVGSRRRGYRFRRRG